MIKMISLRHKKTHTRFELQFNLKGEPKGNGYGFPLINGNTIPVPCKEDESNPSEYIPCLEDECPWWENYLRVKDDKEHYEEPYVQKISNSWMEPAKGICECGETVYLTDEYLGACECPNCGRWYNMFGQELNNPETWIDEYEEDF